MQATKLIRLSEGYLREIGNNVLNNLTALYQELNAQIDNITSLLSDYHWSERGSVSGVVIGQQSLTMNDNTTGKLEVSYQMNLNYGCADISIDLQKSMLIGFEINLAAGTALLRGEDVPEREPDSY